MEKELSLKSADIYCLRHTSRRFLAIHPFPFSVFWYMLAIFVRFLEVHWSKSLVNWLADRISVSVVLHVSIGFIFSWFFRLGSRKNCVEVLYHRH